jgi:hypothetical protein
MGLFPNSGPKLEDGQAALPCSFQPVPVHTVPLLQEYLLRSWFICPLYEQLVEENVVQTDMWRQKAAESEAVLREISSYFNDTFELINVWSMCRHAYVDG